MNKPELKKGRVSGVIINAEGEDIGWIIYSTKALTEAQAAEVIRRVEAHDELVKLLRDAQQYIRPLDPKHKAIEQALAGEPKE